MLVLTMKRDFSKGTRRGHLVREALKGAWRREPQPLEMTCEELAWVTPLLLGSGAAGLGWWRVQRTDLQFTDEAAELQRAYQLNILRATFQERQIEQVFGLLRAAGVEALLFKGWALGRVYPTKGLRPSGDIDLLIRPDQLLKARAVLTGPEASQYFVDYEHEEFEGLDARAWDELCARSVTVRLGAESVRLMSPEDQLRVLCIHLLRHGAWRPGWLADAGVVLESRPRDFDWGRCLGASKREAEWVVSALGLAHKLLGARIDDTPVGELASGLPRWLVAAVLKQWEKPCVIDHAPLELMAASLRHPRGVIGALRKRWPDPIQASIRMRAPLNEWPRLPYQVGEYVSKAATFVTRAAGLRRENDGARP